VDIDACSSLLLRVEMPYKCKMKKFLVKFIPLLERGRGNGRIVICND